MLELVIGLIVGVVGALNWGLDPSGALVVGGTVAVLLYAASCLVWPYRKCWVCGGENKSGDGRGNYHYRWTRCWWCWGAKDNRRIGARLMRRG